MMLMGIDALEADMDTKYIALISRRPGDEVLPKVLNRISECRKPVVVFFMGCERELIESAGAVWAENLDDCAQKCLNLISKEYPLESDEELSDRAAEAVKMLGKEQKYVRGAFSGGTYMDEAMQTLAEKVGPIYSNSPLKEDWRLLDSHVSVENTCIDYGEEEFTLGRPHPAIDPGVRQPAILREAADPETAVILLDFILTPPGHMDPAGYALADIRVAQEQAQARGRHLILLLPCWAQTPICKIWTSSAKSCGSLVCCCVGPMSEHRRWLGRLFVKKGDGRTWNVKRSWNYSIRSW